MPVPVIKSMTPLSLGPDNVITAIFPGIYFASTAVYIIKQVS